MISKSLTTSQKVQAIGNKIQAAVKALTLEHVSDNDLRGLVAYIMTAIGLKNMPGQIEDLVMINYMRSSLSRFTMEEFKIAFNLLADGKLDIHIEHFNSFNTLYLGRIMESYSRFRFKYIHPEQYDEPAKEITTEDLNELVMISFERYKQGKPVTDFGGIQNKYLRFRKLIRHTVSEMDAIMEKARIRYENENSDTIGRVISKENSGEAIKDIARSMALTSFFKDIQNRNIDLKKLLYD